MSQREPECIESIKKNDKTNFCYKKVFLLESSLTENTLQIPRTGMTNMIINSIILSYKAKQISQTDQRIKRVER